MFLNSLLWIGAGVRTVWEQWELALSPQATGLCSKYVLCRSPVCRIKRERASLMPPSPYNAILWVGSRILMVLTGKARCFLHRPLGKGRREPHVDRAVLRSSMAGWETPTASPVHVFNLHLFLHLLAFCCTFPGGASLPSPPHFTFMTSVTCGQP